MKNAKTQSASPNAQVNAPYVWSTYTVLGRHFRFQGKRLGPNAWYVHVCLFRLGEWIRVSYGYMMGAELPDVAAAWALAFARKPFARDL